MGNIGSYGGVEEELQPQEQPEFVGHIGECLQALRSSVHGIVNTIDAHHEHVSTLSKGISDIGIATDEFPNAGKDSTSKLCCHCTSEWQHSTKKLLESIEKSLQYQSQTLLSSYKSTDKCVKRILKYYQIDVSPSVERDAKFWDGYDMAVEKNYERNYQELERSKAMEIDQLNQVIQKLRKQILESKREFDELSKEHAKKIRETEEKVRQLEKENKTLQISKTEIKDRLNTVESVNSSLGTNLKEAEETISRWQSEIETLKEENQDLEKENKTLQISKIEIKDRLNTVESVNSSLGTNLKEAEETMSRWQREIETLKEENQDLEKENKTLQISRTEIKERLNTVESVNSSLGTNLKEAEETMRMFQREIETLKEENQNLEKENKTLQNSRTEIKDRLNTVESVNSSLGTTLKETEETVRRWQRENEMLKEENQDLEKSNEEAKRTVNSKDYCISSLNSEIQALSLSLHNKHMSTQVQLYFNLWGEMMPRLLDELKTLIVSQMKVERHDVQFVMCQGREDVNPGIPLLVLSVNASRLGTDVKTALQNIQVPVSSRVSVVVLHHKDVHALPNQTSDRVLTGPEFKGLGGIFDVAFLKDKGIYPCDMNQAAAIDIEKFLRTTK